MRFNQKHAGGERRSKRRQAGYVGGLWEVLIAFVIVALSFGTIVGGYMSGAVKAQWSGYSLAAQTMASHALEQTRSATWDIATHNTQITNMPLLNKSLTVSGSTWTMTGYMTNILDVPWSSTNYVTATNFISIKVFFANGITNPWVQMEMVRVDTVWPFTGWGNYTMQVYTNTVCALLAPDNRDPTTLGIGGN